MLKSKEDIVKEIILAMSEDLSGKQLQKLDFVLAEKLAGVKIEEECTALSNYLDQNEQMLNLFLANKKLEQCKTSSLKLYKMSIMQMFNYLHMSYAEITTDHVKRFLAWRMGKVSANTLASTKRNISTFFTFLHNEGYIQKHPVMSIKGIKAVEVDTIYLSVEEELRVHDTDMSIKERAIIDFFLSTGVRVGEAAAMRIADVDFRGNSVTFRGEKNDKERTVLLDARAKKHLLEYLDTRTDKSPYLFIGEKRARDFSGRLNARKIGKRALEDIAGSVGERAGVPFHVTCHVFRRTFATRLADAGCPLEVIQELLGHASAETTKKHYIAKSKKRIIKQAERYMQAA